MSKRMFALLAGVAAVASLAVLLALSGSGDRGIDSATGPASPTAPGAAPELPEAPPPTTGRFAVSGRVVRLGSGAAVEGANVTFAGATAVSDAEGRFVLPDVPAGEHPLRVTAEGFTDLERDLAARPEIGDVALLSPTVLVVVVTDVDGRPVPGATIRTIDRSLFVSGSWWEGPAPDQILTGQAIVEDGKEPPGDRFAADEKGEARIEGLAPGTYWVDAAAEGFGTAATEAEVSENEDAAAELVLEEGSSISGRVVDVARRPSAGARIIAIPWNDAIEFPYAVTESTIGGDDGAFRIDGLSRGTEYLLFARAGNGQLGLGMRIEAPSEDVEVICGPRFRLRGRVVDDETGEPLAGVRLFTVLGTATSDEEGNYDLAGMVKSPFFRYVWLRKDGYETQDAEIELTSSFLGGPVVTHDFRMTKYRPATVIAVVRDTTGGPIAGATVVAKRWGEEEAHATALTDSSGEATLTGVRTGGVQLLASKAGYVFVQVVNDGRGTSWANPSEGSWTSTQPGEETRVSLVLSATSSLRGTVTDEAGKPLAGVTVGVGQIESGETGEDGTYEVGGLPRNQNCSVWFRLEGYASKGESVTGGAREVLDVTLSRGAGFEGMIVNEDGRPVGGVSVSAFRDGERWPEQTTTGGRDGKFEISGLNPGEWVLEFEHDGYVSARTAPRALTEGQRATGLRIVLAAGTLVRIVVENPDGTPADGMVLLYGPLGLPEAERLTVSEGVDAEAPTTFRLARGRYRILATSRGNREGVGAAESEREVGAEPEVRIRLTDRPLRFLVRPTGIEGVRIAGIELERTEPALPHFSLWFGQTDRDGVYASPPVLPGKYTLDVYYQKPGQENAWFSSEIEGVSPGPTPIEVDLTN